MVGCWCGYLSGVRCRLAYGPADATATLASVKSRLVYLYRLTRVVPDKGPLNARSSLTHIFISILKIIFAHFVAGIGLCYYTVVVHGFVKTNAKHYQAQVVQELVLRSIYYAHEMYHLIVGGIWRLNVTPFFNDTAEVNRVQWNLQLADVIML